MIARWINGHSFAMEIDIQMDTLTAGDGLKWYPCEGCGQLHKVAMNVVSFFCNDQCADKWEEEHPRQQSEISGYSHACGYHD
jgi:hypothetical protein